MTNTSHSQGLNVKGWVMYPVRVPRRGFDHQCCDWAMFWWTDPNVTIMHMTNLSLLLETQTSWICSWLLKTAWIYADWWRGDRPGICWAVIRCISMCVIIMCLAVRSVWVIHRQVPQTETHNWCRFNSLMQLSWLLGGSEHLDLLKILHETTCDSVISFCEALQHYYSMHYIMVIYLALYCAELYSAVSFMDSVRKCIT